jgi:hypothetical protein
MIQGSIVCFGGMVDITLTNAFSVSLIVLSNSYLVAYFLFSESIGNHNKHNSRLTINFL